MKVIQSVKNLKNLKASQKPVMKPALMRTAPGKEDLSVYQPQKSLINGPSRLKLTLVPCRNHISR